MKQRIVRVVLLMLAVWPTFPSAAPHGLEGRWRLVAQGRASGESPPAPLWLEFKVGGTGLSGFIATERTVAPLPWPAFVTEAGPQRLAIEQRDVDARSGRAVARYRVTSPSPDGQSLLVVEEYQLGADGRTLEGTITVRLIQDGEEKGGYALHRRFEREAAP
jgi:hypothetical protein